MKQERFWQEGMQLSACGILTDELMKDCVLDVILWNVVFAVYYLKFGSIFKWVLLKTKQVQDAAQSLQGTNHDSLKTTNNNCREKKCVKKASCYTSKPGAMTSNANVSKCTFAVRHLLKQKIIDYLMPSYLTPGLDQKRKRKKVIFH